MSDLKFEYAYRPSPASATAQPFMEGEIDACHICWVRRSLRASRGAGGRPSNETFCKHACDEREVEIPTAHMARCALAQVVYPTRSALASDRWDGKLK